MRSAYQKLLKNSTTNSPYKLYLFMGEKSQDLKLKAKKIEANGDQLDFLSALKSNSLGQLYIKNIKKFNPAHSLLIKVLRRIDLFRLGFSVGYISCYNKRWRPLIKLEDYAQTKSLSITKVFDAARVDTPMPKIKASIKRLNLLNLHSHYIFPSVYVAEFKETFVYGGTNLVFTEDAVICHDLYNFKQEYTSEELHCRHQIDEKKMRMRLLRYDKNPDKVAVAASFVDACSFNYAHWMTEVLPRIAAFCTLEHLAAVPIIIDEGLHINIMETLALVAGVERDVITLPIGRSIEVNHLYVTSVAGYAPFEKRYADVKNFSNGLFCPQALQLIRNKLYLHAEDLKEREFSRKIYLKRSSNARNIINSFEIESYFFNKNYIIIRPEELTFLEQVAAFRNSSDIVGPTGAAFANLIFAQPGTRLNIFIAYQEDASFWYWQNLACCIKNEISYIFVETKDKQNLHADFFIDIDELHECFGVI